ncbi:MAG: DUF4236 domain-containing protein [Actinomycetota bacterium]
MSFRFRRSITIVPGVRLNLSKSGISTSIGPRGATINIGHGRVSSTVGLPGTGMSYRTSTSTSSRSKGAVAVRQQTAQASHPRLPRDDQRVLDAISAADITALDEIARNATSEHALAAAMLAGVIAIESHPDWARQMLEWVWAQGTDPGASRFISTYLSTMRVPVRITPEIEVDEALDRNLVGLMIAEWKQADGDLAGAIGVVEQLSPTPAAALSLCESYCRSNLFDEVVHVTDGTANADDVSALLLVYRGVAFRHLGQLEAARLSLTDAGRFRSRSREVRFRALVERSVVYHAQGKLSMARKDLERIRAEDAAYPGLDDAVAALGLAIPLP